MALNIKRVVLGDVTPCGLETGLPALWSNIAPPSNRAKFEGGKFPRMSGFYSVYFEDSGRSVKRGGGDTSSQRATVISPTLLANFCQAARRHMHRTSFPSHCDSLEHFVWPSSVSDYQDCRSVQCI
jgi:hypothetical protein